MVHYPQKWFLKPYKKPFPIKCINSSLLYNWYYFYHNFIIVIINPFVPNAPFLYPSKTSENLTVFWCFQGVEKGCIGNEWVNVTFTIIISFYYLLCHIYEHLLPCYLLIPTQDKNQNQKQKYFFGSVKTWDKLFWLQSNL